MSFRKNIECETFRNVAFLLVFPTGNGECSTSCRQKVRFGMFSCYFLRIIRLSIPVLVCPVLFRGDYYIGYANTFRYKHDVNTNSNTDDWCNLREKRKKKKKKKQNKAMNTELCQNRTNDLLDDRLHDMRFMSQAGRTRCFARRARRGEEKNKALFRAPVALRAKYRVRPAWLMKCQSCRLPGLEHDALGVCDDLDA